VTDPPLTEYRASPDLGNAAGFSEEGYTDYVAAPGCWMGGAHSDVLNPCPYGVTFWRAIDFEGKSTMSPFSRGFHYLAQWEFAGLRNSDMRMCAHIELRNWLHISTFAMGQYHMVQVVHLSHLVPGRQSPLTIPGLSTTTPELGAT
jgi:hypothetical protein